MSKHTPMVVAAARELCRQRSIHCGTNFDDEWKLYGDEDLRDAEAALEACGAPELLEALQDLFGADMERVLMGDGKDDQIAAIAKARAAIAKATGERA